MPMNPHTTRLLRRANPMPRRCPHALPDLPSPSWCWRRSSSRASRARRTDLPGRVGRVAGRRGRALPRAAGQAGPVGADRHQLSRSRAATTCGWPTTAAPRSTAAPASSASAGDTNLHVVAPRRSHRLRCSSHRDASMRAAARARPGRGGAHRHAEHAGRRHASGPVSRRRLRGSPAHVAGGARRRGDAADTGGDAAGAARPDRAGRRSRDPRYVDVRIGLATDGFDTWSADRDRRYERSRVRDLRVAPDGGLRRPGRVRHLGRRPELWRRLVPVARRRRLGALPRRLLDRVGAWGSTWVDYAPWGYAPFHYGRWSYIGGRWGWCPGAYVARPYWAPAMVGWVGGPGWGLSTTFGGRRCTAGCRWRGANRTGRGGAAAGYNCWTALQPSLRGQRRPAQPRDAAFAVREREPPRRPHGRAGRDVLAREAGAAEPRAGERGTLARRRCSRRADRARGPGRIRIGGRRTRRRPRRRSTRGRSRRRTRPRPGTSPGRHPGGARCRRRRARQSPAPSVKPSCRSPAVRGRRSHRAHRNAAAPRRADCWRRRSPRQCGSRRQVLRRELPSAGGMLSPSQHHRAGPPAAAAARGGAAHRRYGDRAAARVDASGAAPELRIDLHGAVHAHQPYVPPQRAAPNVVAGVASAAATPRRRRRPSCGTRRHRQAVVTRRLRRPPAPADVAPGIRAVREARGDAS